jgi:hypothetical protein
MPDILPFAFDGGGMPRADALLKLTDSPSS